MRRIPVVPPMLKALNTALRWFFAASAALFAPALAALASAFLYFTLYGVRAEPIVLVQLYAGYFIVMNLLLGPALARGRREGDIALVALIGSAAALGVLLAARLVFPAWPPAPLLRDLAFVGGGALIAALAYGLAALLT